MSFLPGQSGPLRAVMFFVEDQLAAATWYRDLLFVGCPVTEDRGYWFLDVEGVQVGFHRADPDRNPQGSSTVPYFATAGLERARAAAIAAGARPHRGPLDIGDDRAICQLLDPFGNVFGLDGPR